MAQIATYPVKTSFLTLKLFCVLKKFYHLFINGEGSTHLSPRYPHTEIIHRCDFGEASSVTFRQTVENQNVFFHVSSYSSLAL